VTADEASPENYRDAALTRICPDGTSPAPLLAPASKMSICRDPTACVLMAKGPGCQGVRDIDYRRLCCIANLHKLVQSPSGLSLPLMPEQCAHSPESI
jgi:hypothetical protein